MIEALIAGALAGYGVAMPVGSIGVLLIGMSAQSSLRIGAAAAVGVATADGLYALAAALGGVGAARLIAPAGQALRWTAAIVLIALAIRTGYTGISRFRGRTSTGAPSILASSPGRAYASLLGLTLLNPTTIVYFAALVIGGRETSGTGALVRIAFAAAAFAASASWQLLLAGSGAALGRFLAGRVGRLATALVSSAVVSFLAVDILLSS